MKEYGLKINIGKANVMRINDRVIMKVKTKEGKIEQIDKIQICGEHVNRGLE